MVEVWAWKSRKTGIFRYVLEAPSAAKRASVSGPGARGASLGGHVVGEQIRALAVLEVTASGWARGPVRASPSLRVLADHDGATPDAPLPFRRADGQAAPQPLASARAVAEIPPGAKFRQSRLPTDCTDQFRIPSVTSVQSVVGLFRLRRSRSGPIRRYPWFQLLRLGSPGSGGGAPAEGSRIAFENGDRSAILRLTLAFTPRTGYPWFRLLQIGSWPAGSSGESCAVRPTLHE
jgi:hypothetical protein